MKCLFCGRDFKLEEGEKSCRGCAMFGGCRKIRCPYCGYETVRDVTLWKKKPKSKDGRQP